MVLSNARGTLFSRRMMARKVLFQYFFLCPSDHFIPPPPSPIAFDSLSTLPTSLGSACHTHVIIDWGLQLYFSHNKILQRANLEMSGEGF